MSERTGAARPDDGAPAAGGGRARAARQGVVERPGLLSEAHVLIVEDNPGDARVIVETLKGLCAQAVSCRDAEQAEARLAERSWDLVFIDNALPGLSGLELGRELREGGSRAGLVMLTGQGSERLAVEALKSGFDDYVVKDLTMGYRELLPVLAEEVLRRGADREARERAEQALKESEERYVLAVQGANDAIWDWDLRTHRLYFSPRWSEMLGGPDASLSITPDQWIDLVHPEDRSAVRREIEAHLEGLTPHFKVEYRVKHAAGSWRWVLCRGLCVRDPRGTPVRMAGSQTDITERRLVEERLLHDAFHDPLTGLSNRSHFVDKLRRTVKRSRPPDNVPFAVVFLDLDGFKIVNDTLGHMAGDQLLVQVAQRLLDCRLEDDDVVARFGGDEFALLLDGQNAARDAEKTARRVIRALERPFDVNGREIFAAASIGISLGGDGKYDRAEDVLRDADTAMYRAKAEARSSFRLFETSMLDAATSRLTLEGDLRRALERGQFQFHYQPIVDLSTGRISGFEALIRWHHPERGLIMPDQFIPAAEETGLIIPIGHEAMVTACRQLKAWHAELDRDPKPTLSINLSGRQFADGELMRRLGTAITEAGIDPTTLRLEMTESAIIASEQSVAAKLWQLRALKVGLALDDFGTGYSSLSYLRHFPIDALKIDKSFVQGAIHGGHDAEIVRTVVQLAGSLRMEVIAEGVETTEQLEWLRGMSCGFAQGNLFSAAVDADAATQLLRDDRTW